MVAGLRVMVMGFLANFRMKEGHRVNTALIDVNTSGHLNVFAYRLSKRPIPVKIIRFRAVTQRKGRRRGIILRCTQRELMAKTVRIVRFQPYPND